MGEMVSRFRVEATDEGQRLDQFLAGQESSGLSRTLARRIIDLGGVQVDGRRMRRCSESVRTGQLVEVYRDHGPLDPFVLNPGLVLFQDRFLLAVNKPPQVETQPTPARYKGTLYAALEGYLLNPFRPLDRPTIGMVQRLDRDTSGVILFSIHPRAHRPLTAAFADRSVEKRYLALVQGCWAADSGEIRSLLARSRKENRVHSVEHGGREAITRFKVLERFPAATLVDIEILTGRSHQIRAHCAEAGHPLLGDQRYGAVADGTGRQMLHAVRLNLIHPVTGVPLELEAPLPEDMTRLLARLRGEG